MANHPKGVRFTGAVYTPEAVAAALVDHVSALLPAERLNILEPSVGDGAFLRAMRHRWTGDQFTLVDVDQKVIRRLRKDDGTNDRSGAISFHAQDFLKYARTRIASGVRPFDLVIGNPPFIRSRNFSSELKMSVAALAQTLGYPSSEFKNSWSAFVAASARLLSDNGTMAFILPYELMTVAYGQQALRRLLGDFRRVDVYVSKTKAFPDIDQDAIVLVAQKCGTAEPGLYVNEVRSLGDLSAKTSSPLDLSANSDQALELNAFLLDSETVTLLKRLRRSTARLDAYAGSAPGIVSAANEFFILTKSEVERRGFHDVAIPILKKGSFASHKPEFTNADFQAVTETVPSYLLNIRGAKEKLSAALQEYILEGEAAGYHLRYKCRKRHRWYEVPLIAKEPSFVFKRSHSFPRMCLNQADVYLTDTAYGLRLKAGFTARGLCFSFYNSLTLLFAETDGRFYGGGVLELSPTEFRGLPLVYHEPSDDEYAAFVKVHAAARGDPKPILDFGDAWLAPRLGLSPTQMSRLRQAWAAVRTHRLRHSGRGGSN